MQFATSRSLFLRLAGLSSISVVEPSPPRRVISVLVASFSSSTAGSGSLSTSGQFSTKQEDSRGVRVSVWWDFENCHLPSGVNVFKLAQNITSAVRINGIKGPITITAFGDATQLSRSNQEALFTTGINLTHVPQGGKNSTDKFLIADLMCWVSQNPPPAHLFLISSDSDFASVLHKLRMSNYNILLAGKEEHTKSGVLCSAASIMWEWNDLVRGINSAGKHFNQPPDGPYHSWYGHYRTPLLDPFATSSYSATKKQQSCISVETEESLSKSKLNPNPGSSNVCRPIPEKVVKQISLVVSLYPKGVSITELRKQLNMRNVLIDKDFYGHKIFSRFLLSMPEILTVFPMGKGMFLVRPCTQGKDDKASSKKLNSEDHRAVSVEEMHQKVEENDEDAKEESQSQMDSREPVLGIGQAKNLPVEEMHQKVKENGEDAKEETQSQMSFQEPVLGIGQKDVTAKNLPVKDWFFTKLNRLWFSSPVMEVEHLQEKEHISVSGDKEKDVVSDEKTRIPSSTSNESAEEVKAETEVRNVKSAASPGSVSRFLKSLLFSWGKSTEPTNAATGTQVDDVFAEDSFWKDVESFINSPRGFVVVSHSRSREAMANNLKDEGPSSLKQLDVTKMLDLVSLLLSEKKWIEENPSHPLPFRVSQFTGKSSCLSNNPSVTEGLRSVFVNVSKSLCDEADDGKKSENMGMSQKPLERSRTEVIEDCRKLVKKITEENPGGYNMGTFKKDFWEMFGYRLDYQNLGYTKLQSLIQIMPDVRIESGFIVPSSTPTPYESDSSFEELGPVSKKIHESEQPVSEEENSDSKTNKEASLKQSSGEGKKKTNSVDGTKSDLLQLLSSWDASNDVEKQKDCCFGEDKLIEGVLMGLGKKPSSESRLQG